MGCRWCGSSDFVIGSRYTFRMNTLPLSRFTPAEYFAWEEQQLERHDYCNGEVFAMYGGSDAHNTAAINIVVALRLHLKGSPCRVFMNDMRLQLAENSHYSYPDVFVTCDARDTLPEASHLKKFPVLVIEVLSPITADYDLGLKFEHYRQLDTLQEVLFVDTTRRTADLYQRSTAPQWLLTPLHEGANVVLQSIGLVLPVSTIFDTITP